MKLKTRKIVMSTLVGFVAVAVAGLAVARDSIISLAPGESLLVEDRNTGLDNFIIKDQGRGVEVSRGPLDLKNKTSGGQVKFYEGSGGGGNNSVTVKSPDVLAADVIYTLPNAKATAGQVLQTDGKGVLSWVDQATGGGTAACGSEAVVDVVVPLANGGRTWMDRNLGASRRATSINDALAFGSLFQWGRGRDGHECSQTTYKGPVSDPGISANNSWEGKFIIGFLNWLSYDNRTLWGDGSTKGLNDPCPAGYQVPNDSELMALKFKNGQDAFDVLGLTISNIRYNDGSVVDSLGLGFYWSSSYGGSGQSSYTTVSVGGFTVGGANVIIFRGNSYGYRASGMSVRCIKSR